MKLRVAGAQIPVTDDIKANVRFIEKALDYAADEKADILLTPEGSLSGYTHSFNVKAAEKALTRVTARARKAGIALALGTAFVEDDGKVYDELRFYARDGRFLGFHSKILLCGTMTAEPVGEINHFAATPLRTFKLGSLTVGGLICNDMWANPSCTPMSDPHLAQQLASMGARVVFHSINGGRGSDPWRDVCWQYHESNLRMRARSGRLWVVAADSSHPTDLSCSAPSGVISPEGAWVCRAKPMGEDYFTYTIAL